MAWGGGSGIPTAIVLLMIVSSNNINAAGLTSNALVPGNSFPTLTPPTSLLELITNLFQTSSITSGIFGTDVGIAPILTTGVSIPGGLGDVFSSTTGLGGVAGSLALLAAALKAPLVALYSISAEVVVMVALILFISYIASLLGIEDSFVRRSGLPLEKRGMDSVTSVVSDLLNSDAVNRISNSVYNAIERFDIKEFMENLDTRF